MAFSLHSSRCRIALWLGAALATIGSAHAEERRQEPISLDAASSVVDYRTNTVVFRDVTISQGDISIAADRAESTGLDFENSRWTFKGKVRISAEQRGTLQADEAVIEFRDNRIARATITGSPAQFEQKLTASEKLARGRARNIEYEVDTATVRLSQDAWLTDGSNEISGPLLVYNIREERVQAATQPGANERVRIKILPRGGTGQDGKP